ncbi:MAG: glycosyltransferase family 4 protein [Candidatus Methanoperedens sp.]|nr:glycosyltransferase family 4 protein [Candidatus Methanoperedens sp.]
MKVCHIVPWFPSMNPTTLESRQGIFEYRQILKLIERGHEFKVITIKWKGQSDYENINNIEVFRIPYLFMAVRYPVPNFIKLLNKISEICDNWHPEIIVYAHMEYLTSLPSLYLKNKIKIPVIVTIDNLPGVTWFCGNKIIDTVGYLNSIFIGKKIFKVADGIQFLTSELCKDIPKLDIDANKVFIITRGIDTELFKPRNVNESLRKELGIKDGDIVILYVGRLDLVKGVSYLLYAAKEIILHYKNVKFLIVGDGSLRKEFELFAQHFSENIIFTGYREDIPELMTISNIFVLPSLSEGAANVTMEASAVGLPVISTDVGEIPNIILDGNTGILVKPKDINALVIALKKLVDNPALSKEMGIAGRRRMETEFDWGIICMKIEKAYNNIIEERLLK